VKVISSHLKYFSQFANPFLQGIKSPILFSFLLVAFLSADRLRLKIYKEMPKVKLTTASGFIESPVRLLDQIGIGDIRLENVPVVIPRIPDPAPIKILVGMNLLERTKLEVNGKARTFEIRDP